jgi:hypothetical protein
MVGGPACKIKEIEGLFSKTRPTDRYAAGFNPRPVQSGLPTPDPTAGHACMRLGGGRRGARQQGRRRWPKMSSRPRFCTRISPTHSWGDGEAKDALAQVV